MSDITRVEKLLRASIDGVPCSLKPLTRVEKLLVELNEAIAGPAPTVILPETELTKADMTWMTTSMPENRPEIGKKYNVTCNAETYTWECLSAEEAGMSAEYFESVIALLSESAPFFVMFPTPAVAEAEGCGVMVQGIADTWQPESVTLSIVEAVEESGSAGGGGMFFATFETADFQTFTPDKTFDEVQAAINAGQGVTAKVVVEGMPIYLNLFMTFPGMTTMFTGFQLEEGGTKLTAMQLMYSPAGVTFFRGTTTLTTA